MMVVAAGIDLGARTVKAVVVGGLKVLAKAIAMTACSCTSITDNLKFFEFYDDSPL